MELKKGFEGANPKDFLNKKAIFKIVDITENKRTSQRTKNAYTDLTLNLKGSEAPYENQEFCVMYLFNRDFNKLIDAFGSNTEKWTGQEIEISAKQDGEFLRWNLEQAPAKEEKI